MTLSIPPHDDEIGRMDPGGFPLLDSSNYLYLLPEYTQRLASKLTASNDAATTWLAQLPALIAAGQQMQAALATAEQIMGLTGEDDAVAHLIDDSATETANAVADRIAFVTTRLPINVALRGIYGDGSDITDALNDLFVALEPGDALYFPRGAYHHRGLTIASRHHFQLLGDGAELVCSSTTKPYLQLVGCTDFALDGLISRGANPTLRRGPTRGISIESSDRWSVARCSTTGTEGVGIYVGHGCTSGRIEGCHIRDTKADGIHVTGASRDITITGNQLENTGDDSIAVVSYLTDSGRCRSVSITGNVIRQSHSRGIAVVGGDTVAISSNAVDTTRNAGIYIAEESSYGIRSTANVTISGNTITQANTYGATTNYAGIQVVGSSVDHPVRAISITGNTVTAAAWHGIMVGSGGPGCYAITVTGNTVTDAGVTGILIQSVTDAVVSANLIHASGSSGLLLTGTLGAVVVALNAITSSWTTNTATTRRSMAVLAPDATRIVAIGNTITDPGNRATEQLSFATSRNVLSMANSHPGPIANYPSADGLPLIIPGSTLLAGAQESSGLGAGKGVIGIRNAHAVPTASPASGGIIYVENGALKYRGSSGSVTTIANA
ncbi:MAG: right-handed parallel beta-helix repeat-containing protein [Propioniciclava sp.]|uniref:right-handed parallel beta-helix repeat-containing protein n=1 Tax=Propioniciclava sp. TaxID=2038686 RepID=UPI0039E6A914